MRKSYMKVSKKNARNRLTKVSTFYILLYYRNVIVALNVDPSGTP